MVFFKKTNSFYSLNPITEILKLGQLTICLASVNWVASFHHVMIGGGLAPITRQLTLTGESADSGRLSPTNLIDNGRTATKDKKKMNINEKKFIVFNFIIYCWL